MLIIGLTGGIGMGKTVLASQLAALGAKIINADDIVHRLLSKGGAAVAPVARHFPQAVKNGTVDRKILGDIVFKDSPKRHMLESILHPLVIAEEIHFMQRQRRRGAKVIVLEIPLLFETGGEKRCDVTIVASAPLFLQHRRVMQRPNMTEEKFRRILAAQMPDREKRRRADAVILTGLGRAYSFRKLKQLVKSLCAAK
ncbi:MAG: dephospho-CoA kinase [Pseudomonadota bacterium]|nr:dephospho-CoA kinase [Pseudomonadota bacterium]